MQWFRFFVGTPQRFLATFTVVGLITVLVFPGLLWTAAERLVAEITPLLGPVIMLLIVFAGLRVMFGGFSGGSRRGR